MRELEDMQSRILRAMHLGTVKPGDESSELTTSTWVPVLDISEDDHDYLMKFEIPGVQKDDVHVTVDNGMLTVRGERKFEKEDRKYHRVERCYGSFSRSLSIPDDADPDKVEAEFKDGLLTVKLAKSEARKPKRIEVLVN